MPPTCADDIALAGSNPLDIQILVNIASDYSAREAYTLLPTKSVIIPIKTCSKTTYDNENWYMNDKFLAKAEKAPHIGIQRDSKNSTLATIEENLKKIKKSTLQPNGIRTTRENGLDPATAISILRTYVIPIMLYGLETLLPAGRPFDLLERQYKKMIKQILS